MELKQGEADAEEGLGHQSGTAGKHPVETRHLSRLNNLAPVEQSYALPDSWARYTKKSRSPRERDE